MKKRNFLMVVIMAVTTTLYGQLEINTSGKVGMAGLSPSSSYGLRVNGKIYSNSHIYGSAFGSSSSDHIGESLKLYGGSEATWNVMLTSNSTGKLHINGAQIMTTSDERLKKDKKRIENASEMLTNLMAHTYHYKTAAELENMDFGGMKSYETDTLLMGDSLIIVEQSRQKFAFSKEKQYGFMAQEVKEVLPELVSYDSASGTYGLDYISLIPILVEANKELIARQDLYEERLAVLEKEIEKLAGKRTGSINPGSGGVSEDQEREGSLGFNLFDFNYSSGNLLFLLSGILMAFIAINKSGLSILWNSRTFSGSHRDEYKNDPI